jgi:fucose 4-O-acetylase-like acetyltransferase
LRAEPLSAGSAAVDSVLSAAIDIARLLCILGVVYVHGWTGLTAPELTARADTFQGILRWTMVELFGRSAVPLLSLISGWLVARSAYRRSGWAFIAGKFRAIALPMVAWNLIALVLVVGVGMAGWIAAPRPTSIPWVLNQLFNLTEPGDIDVQMAFLRDLFLCMMIAPWLVRRPSKTLMIFVALTIAWVIGAWRVPILLRPAILLFFLCGILAGRYGIAERIAAIPFRHASLPFLLIVPFKVALSIAADRMPIHHAHLIAIVDLAIRFAAAAMVWRLAMLLAARHRTPLLRLEPYIFLLFCSHLITMWLVGPLIGAITGPMGHPLWPIYFLLQPLLALGLAIALAKGTAILSPVAARLLSGGRIRHL